MAAGTIQAAIKLDYPDRVYRGSGQPVTGNVVLTSRPFRPNLNGQGSHAWEFFGPTKIPTSFHGRLKTKLRVSNGNSSSTYRGRVPIFKQDDVIFDDSAKIQAGETWLVPFECSFPDAFQYDIESDWEKDARFDGRQDQQLPPSFTDSYYGFKTHYDSFIEYRVGVMIHVPQLPVKVVTPEKYGEPLVHYERPSQPKTLEARYHHLQRKIHISNEFLLPPENRPSGFRQNMKAKLSSDFYPNYSFEWALVAPK